MGSSPRPCATPGSVLPTSTAWPPPPDPGLIGGVMVGLIAAEEAIAMAHAKPLIAVNHLEGHALSPRLAESGATFPYLLLLMSGGHCQFIGVMDVGVYRRYGSTIDDALGEAFDKLAKLLDLGFPGGPLVEESAKTGNSKRFSLPRPMLGRDGCDLSFAGLKTACVREVERLGTLDRSRQGRSLRQLPGGGCGRALGSHRQCDDRVRYDLGARRAGLSWPAASPPMRRSVPGSKRWRGRGTMISWRPRSVGAPTMPR